MNHNRGIVVGVAIIIATLMVVTSFSSVMYSNVSATPSAPNSAEVQGGHNFLVTISSGNQTYSYYEEVQNNKILKTWPAASAPSMNNPDGGSGGTASSSYTSGVSTNNGLLLSPSSEAQSGVSNLGHSHNPASQSSSSPDYKHNSVNAFTLYYSDQMDMGQALTITQNHKISDSLVYLWASTNQTFQTDSFQLLTISTISGPGTSLTYVLTSPITPGIWYLEVSKSGNQGTPGEGGGSIVSNVATITVYADPTVSVATTTVNYDSGQQPSAMASAATVTYLGASSHSSDYSDSSSEVYVEWFASSTSTFTYSSGDSPGYAPVQYGTSFTPPVPATGSSASTTYYFAVVFDGSVYGGYSYTSSGYIRVMVSMDPTVSVSSTPGPYTYDVGQTSPAVTALSAGVTYSGTGTATVNWYLSSSKSTPEVSGNSLESGTASPVSFTPPVTASGTYYYFAQVTDSLVPSYTSNSALVEVIVNADPTVSITPSSGQSLDVGQTASALTAVVSPSGSNTASVEWYYGSSSGITSLSDLTYTGITGVTFTPPTTAAQEGTLYYYAVVYDSALAGYSSISSNSVEVTVYSDPTVALSVDNSGIDVGQAATLTASPSNGYGPYTYNWQYEGPGDTSWTSISSSSSTYSFSSNSAIYTTVGTYYFEVSVTDSLAYTSSYSNTVTVTVNADPTVFLTSSTTSGEPYIYDVGQTASTLAATVTYSGASTYSGDGLFDSSSNAIYVQWFSSSSSEFSSANAITGAYGTSFTPVISTGSTGGTTTYYWAVVYDTNVQQGPIGVTSSVAVTVYPEISLSNFEGSTVSVSTGFTSPVSMDLGQSLFLEVTASGGYGTLQYQWWLGQPGNGGTTLGTGGTNPTTTGSYTLSSSDLSLLKGSDDGTTYTLYVLVSDTNGVAKSTTLTVTIFSDPTVSVTSSSANYDQGQIASELSDAASVTYSGESTTDSGAFDSTSYTVYVEWYYSFSSDLSSPTATGQYGLSFTPYTTSDFSGTTYYFAVVFDTNVPGVSAFSSSYYTSSSTSYVKINVYSDPTVALSVDNSGIDVGQTATLTASPSNGYGTYTYDWQYEGPSANTFSSISDSSSSSATYAFSSSNSAIYTIVGTYSFEVSVTDSLAYTSSYSSTVTVTVNADPIVSLSVDNSGIDTSQTATLTATASYGYGSYTYNWQYEGPGVTSWTSISDASSSSTTYVFSSSSAIYAGTSTYSFDVSVTDGLGYTSSYSSTVTVTVSSPLVAPEISIGNSAIDAAQSTSLSVVSGATGGTQPYTYEWLESINGGSYTDFSGSDGSTSISTGTLVAGTYSFELQVTDSSQPADTLVSSPVTVTVNEDMSSSSVTLSVTLSLSYASLSPTSYATSISMPIEAIAEVYTYSFDDSGTAPYTGVWMSSPTSSVSGFKDITTTNPFTLDTSTLTNNYLGVSSDYSGVYYFILQLSDSAGESVYSNVITVTVTSSALTAIITPTPSSASVDVGQLLSFSSSVTGGTPGYTYQWYLNGTTPVGTGSSYSFRPEETAWSGATFYLSITDSTSSTTSSNIITIAVNSGPTVSVSPTGPLDYYVYQASASLTATVSNPGSTTPSVEWFSNSADSYSSATDTGVSGLWFTPSTNSPGITFYFAQVTESDMPGYQSPSNIVSVDVSTSSSCVLYGTPISITPDQSVPVQDLQVGQNILSYNTSDGQLIEEVVLAIKVTNVTSIFDINNGLLYVSGATDQPIYVKLLNGTQKWVMIGNLTTSESMFDPINGTWIPVNSIQILTGNYTVYDIDVSNTFQSAWPGGGNYIANGILLLDKRSA